ncbi:MAG: hypothetical protein Q8K69_01900, partial [Bacteroidota bacterium]|nr:hypothetical protein [Bacteroidota bacterium]
MQKFGWFSRKQNEQPFSAQENFMAVFKLTATSETAVPPEKRRMRIAVALFYFSMGLCFASWASRIPDIKTA